MLTAQFFSGSEYKSSPVTARGARVRQMAHSLMLLTLGVSAHMMNTRPNATPACVVTFTNTGAVGRAVVPLSHAGRKWAQSLI